MPMLKVGDIAPDFELQDQAGRSVRLADFAGRTVVLWFYPKADTPGWTAEGCGFRDLHNDYRRKGVEVLGASFDTVEENAAFARKFAFPFPLLSDPERRLGLAYGACDDVAAGNAQRITYVIGPDRRVREAMAKVDARAHPADLLQRL